jgi:hypothetical protein
MSVDCNTESGIALLFLLFIPSYPLILPIEHGADRPAIDSTENSRIEN